MTTISRAAFAAAVEAGQKKVSIYPTVSGYSVNAPDIVEAAFAAAGLTVRDPDPAPPAVVRISRARYEAGVLAAGKASRLHGAPAYAPATDHDIADAFLAAARIEVEPERTPEERLAEIEARLAAFVAEAQGWAGNDPGTSSLWALVARHFPEVRRDGR